MQLQDIENEVLFNTQQSEMLNYGGEPNWGISTNPALQKRAVDFQINRAYMRVIQDFSDIQLALYRFVFASLAQVSDYPLPPYAPPYSTLLNESFLGSMQLGAPPPQQAGVWGQGQWGTMLWGTTTGAPRIQRITRIIYNPIGQPWSQDFEGGVRLIGWQEFMRRCGFGYLRPFCYDTIPDFCAMSPDRKMLSFFPGTGNAGDIIGVEYIPELTANSDWPLLVNADDSPQLPDETHDCIVLDATRRCWAKLREFGARQQAAMEYKAELERAKDQLAMRSLGDTKCIRDANDGIALSYIFGGALIP